MRALTPVERVVLERVARALDGIAFGELHGDPRAEHALGNLHECGYVAKYPGLVFGITVSGRACLGARQALAATT